MNTAWKTPHYMTWEEWDYLRSAQEKGELKSIDIVKAVMDAIKDETEAPLKDVKEWLAEKVDDDGIFEDDLLKGVSIISRWLSREMPVDKIPTKEAWANNLLIEALMDNWRTAPGSGIKQKEKKKK